MPVFMQKSHSYIKQKVTKISKFNQATPSRPLCQFLNHTKILGHWRFQEYFSRGVKKIKLIFFLKKNLNISSYKNKNKMLIHEVLQFPFISFYILKQLCNSSFLVVVGAEVQNSYVLGLGLTRVQIDKYWILILI